MQVLTLFIGCFAFSIYACTCQLEKDISCKVGIQAKKWDQSWLLCYSTQKITIAIHRITSKGAQLQAIIHRAA